MRKVLVFISRFKWIGLIGILGDISGNPYLKLFWLIMLLGFVEIFYNMPVFLQSIKQTFSIPITFISHNFRLASKDNYTCKSTYLLPFEEKWSVVNGGVDKMISHSWGILPQRYAYDFLVIDENGKSHTGDGKSLIDYYCYGLNVVAPADGDVVSIGDKCADSMLYTDGTVNYRVRDIRGNYVTIKHNDYEYSTIAHIMPKSILVVVGQKVKQGEIIAKCGNSGNSSEPHIHLQIQDSKSFYSSAGLPIQFSDITITENVSYKSYDTRPIPIINNDTSFMENDRKLVYIQRGQTVENNKEKCLLRKD